METLPSDLLRKFKAKSSFCGNSQSYVLWTTQRRTQHQRRNMKYLSGDTFFNRWPIPSVAFSQLARLDMATHEKLFDTSSQREVLAFAEDPDEETGAEALAEETELRDEVIPFPTEHHMSLGQELIFCFEIGVVVLFHPAAGQMLRAVLAENCRAVAVCCTQTHKQFLLQGLMDWVKVARLASLQGAPAKPAELLAYESKQRGGPAPAAAGTNTPQKSAGAARLPDGPSLVAAGGASAVPTVPTPALAAFGAKLL